MTDTRTSLHASERNQTISLLFLLVESISRELAGVIFQGRVYLDFRGALWPIVYPGSCYKPFRRPKLPLRKPCRTTTGVRNLPLRKKALLNYHRGQYYPHESLVELPPGSESNYHRGQKFTPYDSLVECELEQLNFFIICR